MPLPDATPVSDPTPATTISRGGEAGGGAERPGAWPPRARLALWANVAWMTLVWVTRIRNASDAGTSSTWAYVLSALGLGGAVALAVVAIRGWNAVVVGVVAWGHASLWAVRAVQIGLGDRAVGFKVVHVVLGAISIALAGWLIALTRAGRVEGSGPASSRA